MEFLPELTIRYKTYVKNTMVESLASVFSRHPDELLQGTKVTIEYPRSMAEFPAVVIRFFERDIRNAGVGHVENLVLSDGSVAKFKHYFYTADIEFAVYALSSYDRDLVADSIVQTISMGELDPYTNQFFDRVYPDEAIVPDAALNFINVNSDVEQGFGETEVAVPWGSEDDILYMTSYRVGLFGEFYSLPPNTTYGLVKQVIEYPYIDQVEDVPTGTPGDDGIWIP